MTALSAVALALSILALAQTAITHHKLGRHTHRDNDPVDKWLEQLEHDMPQWLAQFTDDDED